VLRSRAAVSSRKPCPCVATIQVESCDAVPVPGRIQKGSNAISGQSYENQTHRVNGLIRLDRCQKTVTCFDTGSVFGLDVILQCDFFQISMRRNHTLQPVSATAISFCNGASDHSASDTPFPSVHQLNPMSPSMSPGSPG
jgi:hypothetical protein